MQDECWFHCELVTFNELVTANSSRTSSPFDEFFGSPAVGLVYANCSAINESHFEVDIQRDIHADLEPEDEAANRVSSGG